MKNVIINVLIYMNISIYKDKYYTDDNKIYHFSSNNLDYIEKCKGKNVFENYFLPNHI